MQNFYIKPRTISMRGSAVELLNKVAKSGNEAVVLEQARRRRMWRLFHIGRDLAELYTLLHMGDHDVPGRGARGRDALGKL